MYVEYFKSVDLSNVITRSCTFKQSHFSIIMRMTNHSAKMMSVMVKKCNILTNKFLKLLGSMCLWGSASVYRAPFFTYILQLIVNKWLTKTNNFVRFFDKFWYISWKQYRNFCSQSNKSCVYFAVSAVIFIFQQVRWRKSYTFILL